MLVQQHPCTMSASMCSGCSVSYVGVGGLLTSAVGQADVCALMGCVLGASLVALGADGVCCG